MLPRTAIAVATGMGSYTEIWPRDIIGASVLFCLLWCLAGALFHAAAAHRQGPEAVQPPS